jgi:hypothetical protein
MSTKIFAALTFGLIVVSGTTTIAVGASKTDIENLEKVIGKRVVPFGTSFDKAKTPCVCLDQGQSHAVSGFLVHQRQTDTFNDHNEFVQVFCAIYFFDKTTGKTALQQGCNTFLALPK